MKRIKLTNNIWIWCALALPPLIVIAMILYAGANTPIWDEWDSVVPLYKGLIESKKGIIDILAVQINQHRVPVPAAIQMLIWSFTRCNNLIILVISQLCMVGVLIAVVLYWRKKQLPLILLLPISVLLFTFKQGIAQFWTSCFVYTCYALFTVLSFFYFEKFFNEENDSKKKIFFVLTILFGVCSTYSFASGLLIWIAYAALFIAQKLFENKKFFTKWNVIILASGIICWVLYFKSWDNGDTTLVADNILQIILTVVYMAANPFFNTDGSAIAYLVGSFTIAIVFVLAVIICARKKISSNIFPILMTISAFGSMILTATGRAGSDAGYIGIALSTQYTISCVLFLVGAYLLILKLVSEKTIENEKIATYNKVSAVFYIVFFFSSISFLNTEGFYWMDRSIACSYAVQNYNDVPDRIFDSYVSPYDKQFEILDWMRENKLFLFSGYKQYEYPYDGFVLAKEIHEIGLPEIQTEASDFWIDSINGIELEEGKATVKSVDGIDVKGWALDELNLAVPSEVYLEIDGRYYQLTSASRPDVAQAYGNENYTESGVIGFVSLVDYTPGTYAVNIVGVSADGASYYRAQAFELEIT